MTILPITMTIAAGCALLNLWLTWRVGQIRQATKVNLGDGGQPALIARMRAHANFAEFTPFFLILLGLVELARGPRTWLWAVAIAYVIARILHAFGMDRPLPSPMRMIGILVTLLALLILAIYALVIVYGGVRPA